MAFGASVRYIRIEHMAPFFSPNAVNRQRRNVDSLGEQHRRGSHDYCGWVHTRVSLPV